jgi:hypothetical protein
MPRKSLHIIKQTWKTPCGEYRNAFCIELTFKLCTCGYEKQTLSKRVKKKGNENLRISEDDCVCICQQEKGDCGRLQSFHRSVLQ